MENVRIVGLSKIGVFAYLASMRKLDSEIIGESWNDANFLLDLPGKWEYSLLALDGDTLAGFLIASVKGNDILHVHRIVIAQNYRRLGLGSGMLKIVSQKASLNGVRLITLKTAIENTYAQEFYRKIGFTVLDRENSRNLLFSISAEKLLHIGSMDV